MGFTSGPHTNLSSVVTEVMGSSDETEDVVTKVIKALPQSPPVAGPSEVRTSRNTDPNFIRYRR